MFVCGGGGGGGGGGAHEHIPVGEEGNLVRRIYTRDASSRMHIGMLLLLFVDVALGP